MDTLEAIRYNIKNGKLEGTWQIKDRKGKVLEKGEYKNGQKSGTREVISYSESELKEANEQVRVEIIHFKNGEPKKSITTIEDKVFVWEETFDSQLIRKQIVIKRFKHFAVKK